MEHILKGRIRLFMANVYYSAELMDSDEISASLYGISYTTKPYVLMLCVSVLLTVCFMDYLWCLETVSMNCSYLVKPKMIPLFNINTHDFADKHFFFALETAKHCTSEQWIVGKTSGSRRHC